MTNSRLLRRATLDRVGDLVDDAAGRPLRDLPPFTTLLVWTMHALYRVVVTFWPEVYVQADTVLSHPASTYPAGASFRESRLRMGWIGEGLFVEIRAGGRHIITSPVVAITTEQASSSIVH